MKNLTTEESALLQTAQRHSNAFKVSIEKGIDIAVEKKIKNLNQKQTQALNILAECLKAKI